MIELILVGQLFVLSLAVGIIVMLLALLFQWFDRKVHARYQHRVGPLITGPHGILQPLADLIKLLTKETVILKGSDELLIVLSALSIVGLTIFAFMFLPIIPPAVISISGDLFILVAISVLVSIFIIIAGYSVNSPYSNVGAARTAQLIISYEIPFILAIAAVAFTLKSITIQEIIMKTTTLPEITFSALDIFKTIMIAIAWLLAFIVYVFSAVAKVEKVPFDVPEAETELGAGWQTEFSGRILALFKLGMDLKYLFVSYLGAVLFFGGIGYTGIAIVDFFGFLLKALVIAFIITTIRSIVARYRIDQVINLFWKTIIPLGILQLFIVLSLRIFGLI